MSKQTFVEGKSKELSENAFTRSGYTFNGWATTPTGSATYTDKQSIKISKDQTLYAVWKSNASSGSGSAPSATCTVTFNENGGSGTMPPQTFTKNVAQTLTANAFTRSGYTFSGWATSSSGSVKYSNRESITISESITLYAKWTYNYSSGSSSSGSSSGGSYTPPSYSSANFKVIYLKQKLNADGTDKAGTDDNDYEAESPITERGIVGRNASPTIKTFEGFESVNEARPVIKADGSTVVKVKYNRKSATVTFDAGDGNFNDGEKTKTLTGVFGAKFTAPSSGITPPSGKAFSKWTPEISLIFGTDSPTYTAEYVNGASGGIDLNFPTRLTVKITETPDSDGTITLKAEAENYTGNVSWKWTYGLHSAGAAQSIKIDKSDWTDSESSRTYMVTGTPENPAVLSGSASKTVTK